ncbi:MAG TPA: hypothetical protein VET66_02480 [Steroidobacteraceae bacterium]|nr:hypothetical protein [Steroidobacteraceae bacterium]
MARTDLARQVGNMVSNDLPALLVDALGTTPAQPAAVGAALERELARMIRVCGEERRLLGSRQARQALAVRLSLARVASATTLLHGTVRRCATALWRTDPRLLSLAGAAAELPTISAVNLVTCEECRQVAAQLRQTLREVADAAERIQRAMRGPRAADPATVTAALAQTSTLVGWLRQAQGADDMHTAPAARTNQARPWAKLA